MRTHAACDRARGVPVGAILAHITTSRVGLARYVVAIFLRVTLLVPRRIVVALVAAFAVAMVRGGGGGGGGVAESTYGHGTTYPCYVPGGWGGGGRGAEERRSGGTLLLHWEYGVREYGREGDTMSEITCWFQRLTGVHRRGDGGEYERAYCESYLANEAHHRELIARVFVPAGQTISGCQ